jgi:hypothetical protein
MSAYEKGRLLVATMLTIFVMGLIYGLVVLGLR